ncbi:polyphosphate polymerase domain-containing protein [Sedimentibacter sp. zth1]|uniref:polyphosphate polymerase domain-containing protein n=1 Tax=Sedimentibacter sp. zth1 TaxID=2816908 RepID=UPI001A925B2D|nr:polyphosphate polymerase domain-containing protein [Sedimentibacter sp. zth1]QSX05776.1 polyphosphate polymerase domain-containing protein [Sedimentibacter sp. zth1]
MDKKTNYLKIYRHEVKYYISKKDAYELSLILSYCMKKDLNSKKNGDYYIRSLYFDTFNNIDYYEKQIGTASRKKVRLRLYDTTSPSVKLEIKNKFGSYMQKETCLITRNDAAKLINGHTSILLKYNSTTVIKVLYLFQKALYKPVITIDYDREAFMLNFENIRITIDKNIRASCNNYDIFNENIIMNPLINVNTHILEVKFNNTLPNFIQKILSKYTLQRESISKYCIARKTNKK